jgi:hypothetical protein
MEREGADRDTPPTGLVPGQCKSWHPIPDPQDARVYTFPIFQLNLCKWPKFVRIVVVSLLFTFDEVVSAYHEYLHALIHLAKASRM